MVGSEAARRFHCSHGHASLHLRYPGRVQTVERYGSLFQFRVRPFDAVDPKAKTSELIIVHDLEFSNHDAAATFLRKFSGNALAIRGLESIVLQAGGVRQFDELPEQWIDRLAPHLVSGRVVVAEQVPRAPAGDASEVPGPSPQPTPPVP